MGVDPRRDRGRCQGRGGSASQVARACAPARSAARRGSRSWRERVDRIVALPTAARHCASGSTEGGRGDSPDVRLSALIVPAGARRRHDARVVGLPERVTSGRVPRSMRRAGLTVGRWSPQPVEKAPHETRRFWLGHSIGVFGLGRFVVVIVAECTHRHRNEDVRAWEGLGVAFGAARFRSTHDAPVFKTLDRTRTDVKGRSSPRPGRHRHSVGMRQDTLMGMARAGARPARK